MLTDPTAERAADDVLLLLAQLDSPDVRLPTAEDVVATLSPYMEGGLSAVEQFRKRNPQQARGAQAGFSAGVNALMSPATSHLLLSIRLLAWAADRTGLTHAQVVAEVLAAADDHTEPEG